MEQIYNKLERMNANELGKDKSDVLSALRRDLIP
ncbi:unnamed protein product [Prunus brigantina]